LFLVGYLSWCNSSCQNSCAPSWSWPIQDAPSSVPTIHDASVGSNFKFKKQDASWPALPLNRGEAELLVYYQTRRKPDLLPHPSLAPKNLLKRLSDSKSHQLVVGYENIIRWFESRLASANKRHQDSYLLWGTYHDSAGQMETFRHLIGPGGIDGLTQVVVEQFDADGGWSNIPLNNQRGDTKIMAAYLKSGDLKHWNSIAAKQLRENYTAWKYNYLFTVMDLLLASRASGIPVLGCDMPRSLQNLADSVGSHLFRLRELHCLFALKKVAQNQRGPLRVAMLWGQDHVTPHGIRRYIDPHAVVISAYVFGFRPDPQSPERQLRSRLILNDPVLLPLEKSEEQVLVLLPGPDLGGNLDRSRVFVDLPPHSIAEKKMALLRIHSPKHGVFEISDKIIPLRTNPQSITLLPGEYSYRLGVGQSITLGTLFLPEGGLTEVQFDPFRRSTVIIYGEPYP
jgi:hypothetical protein